MAPLFNLARMTVASSGTGNITLSNAVQGFLTFDLAGCSTLAAGQSVSYAINDTNNSEIGTGTYFSSSLLLTRNPNESTNGGSPIDMSNAAQVFITPRAEDLYPVPVGNGGTGTTTQQSSDRVLITTTSGVYTTDANLTYTTSNDSLGVSNIAASSNIGATGSLTAGTQSLAPVGSVGTPSFSFTGDLNTGFYRPSADVIGVSNNGVETFRFRDDNNVAITGVGSSVSNLDMVNSQANTDSAFGIRLAQTMSSAVGTFYKGVSVQPVVGAFTATSTVASIANYYATFGTVGANAAVTDLFGFYADTGLGGKSSNVYGFYSNIASGTNRWNFYAAGTAQNLFQGITTFGSTINATGLSNAAVIMAGGLAATRDILLGGKLVVASTTTIPAGGSSVAGAYLGAQDVGIFFGSGAPTIAATQGSLYLRTNGSSATRLYVAATSTGSWVAIFQST